MKTQTMVVIDKAWLQQTAIRLSGRCRRLKQELRELEAAAVAYEEDSEMVTYGDPRIRARKSDEYRAKAEQIRIAKAVANFIKRLSKKEGKVKSESSGVPCVTIG